jgi:glutathione S-transferase
VADFVAAYTLDMAAVLEKHRLLDNLPRLRGFMERMYKRPNAPPRIVEAVAQLAAALDEPTAMTTGDAR